MFDVVVCGAPKKKKQLWQADVVWNSSSCRWNEEPCRTMIPREIEIKSPCSCSFHYFERLDWDCIRWTRGATPCWILKLGSLTAECEFQFNFEICSTPSIYKPISSSSSSITTQTHRFLHVENVPVCGGRRWMFLFI